MTRNNSIRWLAARSVTMAAVVILSASMNGLVLAAEWLTTGENSAVGDGRTVWIFSSANGADIRIDRNGKPAGAPVAKLASTQPKGFAVSRPYSDGFAAVEVGDHCGYVDDSGVLKPQRFLACGDFHDHLAKVVTLDVYATYVSPNLTPIHAGMPAKDDSPGLWFNDGLAPMRDDFTKLWGYINAQGQWSIAPQFQVAGSFSEGLAPVESLDSRDRLRLGFIDRAGKLVIPYKFGSQAATGHWVQFSEGRAIVADPARYLSQGEKKAGATVEDPRRARYGVIDTAGRWVSPLRFQSCGACVYLDGRAQAFGPGQKLIDSGGRIVWSAK
ncbi:WG repeat-containing protein [Paraburkholderia sp.]|uniref:WG repeat-containing protein n=1 Tax=Paraburkholderia sp. TaxID=1926495 RepID=UPI003C74C69C